MNSNEEILLSSLCDWIMAFCSRLNKRLDAADIRVAEIQASRQPEHESSTYEQPWMPSYWEMRPPPLPDPYPPYNLVAPDQLDGQQHFYNQPPHLPYNEPYGQSWYHPYTDPYRQSQPYTDSNRQPYTVRYSQPYADTDPSWGNSFNYGLNPYQQPGNAEQQYQQPHNPHWCPSESPQQLQLSHTRRPTCWDPPQARQPYGWNRKLDPSKLLNGSVPSIPATKILSPSGSCKTHARVHIPGSLIARRFLHRVTTTQ